MKISMSRAVCIKVNGLKPVKLEKNTGKASERYI